MLREQGYSVLEAEDGPSALRIAQERAGQEIHLLLTDVVMPQMNGAELARMVVALHPETKVLYTSGYPDEIIRQRHVIASGIAFVQKPFTPETLARKVRRALDA